MKKSLLLLLSALLCLISFASCKSETDLPEETSAPEVTETTPPEVFTPVLPKVPTNDEARKIVVDYMKEMAGIRWICKEKMDYREVVSFTSGLIYNVGHEYYGLPYVGGTSNAQKFLSKLDENGNYVGSPLWSEVPGNTCASSIYVAYTTISTDDTNASSTENYFPSAGKGMVPVGDYSLDKVKDIKKTLTTDIVRANGQDRMSEAMACLRPGDVVLSRWAAGSAVNGHTRLVSSLPTIVRYDNGKINVRESTIALCEQCSSFDERDRKHISTWKVDEVFTFSDLLGDGYIPLTLEELALDSFEAPEVTVTGLTKPEKITAENMLKGTIRSNYKIFEVHVTISDENGNRVAGIDRLVNDKTVQLPEIHYDNDVTSLPAGTYHFRMDIRIGLGTFTYSDFTFTVEK